MEIQFQGIQIHIQFDLTHIGIGIGKGTEESQSERAKRCGKSKLTAIEIEWDEVHRIRNVVVEFCSFCATDS